MKNALVSALTAALVCACFYVFGRADASRDAAGTMTYAASSVNPAVFGTPISPTDFNAMMTDIKAELTDSLSRSGKGNMLAQLKLFDGTVGTPGLGWGSETGTGFRRAAAGDIRFGVSGVDKLFFNSTGLGIGVAPTHPLDMVVSGSAATALANFLEPASANGNSLSLNVGQALAANQAGSMTYTQNATAANSTWCMGVAGNPSTLCVDGNAKVYIGASGTAIGASLAGSAAYTPGTVTAATCATVATVTVTGAAAGAPCEAAMNASLGVLHLNCWVTSNTCNVQVCNANGANQATGATSTSCRVWNP